MAMKVELGASLGAGSDPLFVYVRTCEKAAENGASGSCFRRLFHRTLTVRLAAWALTQASTVSSLHVQAGSRMEKTYSFSFPESRIFLAKPFRRSRLKGDFLRIEAERECVCFQ
jgi:hypothetical protein